MLYNEKKEVISLSVGELVTLSLCRYASEIANDRAYDIVGTLPTAGAACPVSYLFKEGDYTYALSADVAVGEEVPGLPPPLLFAFAVPCPPDIPGKEILRRVRGEAFLSAFLYMQAKNVPAVTVQVTLSHPAEGADASFEETVSRSAGDKFFARLRACLGRVGGEEADRVSRRLPSLRSLKFPYSVRRESQDELMQTAFRTLRGGRRLFACAPTGTGKTAGVLYPALRALGAGYCERIFYLTPKTTTAAEVARALSRFAAAGAKLRAVLLTSKEHICPEKLSCRDPLAPCTLFRAGGEKEEAAALALLESDAMPVTEKEIRDVAARYQVCPYELSLRYSMFCDVIVCDYNYLFDPRVYLRRYFTHPGNYCFLVDEAHDLLERAREMYSTSLTLSSLDALLRHARSPGGTPEIAEAVKDLRAVFARTMKAGLHGARRQEGGNKSTAFAAEKAPPNDLFFTAARVAEMGIAAMGDRSLPLAWRREMSAMCYPLRDFAARADFYSDRFETFYIKEDNEYTLRVVCLDPSEVLDTRLACGKSAVLFSATLTPLDYYRSVLGGSGETLLLDSPFETDNLCVAVMDKINTRLASRTESAPAIAEAIYAQISARVGNYFVFCPSFAYMDEVCRRFHDMYPSVTVIAQKKGSNRATRDAFLSAFTDNPQKTLVGFCVTGGVFAEGVDLAGTRLIGAAVIGTSIPGISPEREAMTAYYGEKYEKGKEYAYLYPGMNRVLQAAGRVIRTEEDRGTLLLMDDRFADPFYRSLIPAHWRHLKFTGTPESAAALFTRFWQTADTPPNT